MSFAVNLVRYSTNLLITKQKHVYNWFRLPVTFHNVVVMAFCCAHLTITGAFDLSDLCTYPHAPSSWGEHLLSHVGYAGNCTDASGNWTWICFFEQDGSG
ncbi:hypothetical protein M378DRAFT_370342 [Amanita muscaria Koide BX008]|uniref:Uncharacterized protein n=1 Tax=Amanita muscaria (strain Koide BX008) TaxID=946122 RepID=A0A0C2TI35_AMAMK|nr:hypothetical protein M378DRAFT_370342 [Amanita muscaria Koide BX008]